MDRSVLRRIEKWGKWEENGRNMSKDGLGTNLYLLRHVLTRSGNTVVSEIESYLSKDERQLRGGKEERQLWERLTEMMEASARPGQKVDRSRERRPEPVT